MSQNPAFDKLVRLLKELFQLDQPDLDFGLYRIMHARADEISQFLDRDLLPQVKDAFSQYQTADKAELEKELAELITGIEKAGMNPEESPKVQELRQNVAEQGVDVAGLEQEVYDHLFKFFRRYYHEGDFLAKRVYKPGVYAIPYEGEEVKLHWANKDQYYIKTSEYLRDYAFTLKPGADDPMRVHFRLADAAEGEHGNVKEAEGNNRVFVLAREDFIAEEDGESGKELVIRFQYRPATMDDWSEDAKSDATAAAKKKPPTQKDLRADAVRRILAAEDESLTLWLAELAQTHIKADGEPADYSRLAAHMNRYTARNTFDYFIHKNLGGFLRRELDFYIKNEVIFLDDIESDTAPRVDQYLSKIKVIRQIAGKVIEFLAQLESFQKKLWLKKKFVTETSWCIRVSCIPEEFYFQIAANEAQREEWVNLHAIDEIESDLTTVAYSEPLAPDFLKSHPTLMVDTQHFDEEFVQRLLEAVGDVDGQTDGVLFHSENFQSLSLLQVRYREMVKCISIDPPYNRNGDGFPYKDNYRHSSWLTMMQDRLNLALPLLSNEGALFSNIDENEQVNLRGVLDDVFGFNNRIEELIWAQNTTHSQSPLYSTNHEYIEVYVRDRQAAEQAPGMFREPKPGFRELMELVEELNPRYPPIAEIEDEIRKLFTQHREAYRREVEDAGMEFDAEAKKQDPWRGLYNYSNAEYRSLAGKLVEEEKAKPQKAKLFIWQEADASAPAQKQSESTRDSEHPNYRFYRPKHPVTGKLCPHPKRGWAWPYSWSEGGRDSFEALDAQGLIHWGHDENKVPRYKRFVHTVDTNVAKSFFYDYTDGEKQIAALFGKTGLFPTPKPTTLPARFIDQVSGDGHVVVDFFAGSGTTGDAIIGLNRKEGDLRKFILCEMGEYFDTVLLPRLKKVVFTPEWKDGKPKRLATDEEADRSPRIMKVVRLESYEDALNNLEPRRTETQGALLESVEAQGPDGLREQYLLRYMLDVETRGSQSLLNIDAFTDPTAYRLKVKRPGSEETRETCVDLLETFNWLIGLTVETIASPQTVNAVFKRGDDPDLPEVNPRRLLLDGRLREDADGPWWFRTVTGTTPDGRKTLVIWRKLTGEAEQDNLVLDEWFQKQGYSSKDSEFDLIYVNGDNNLENLRQPDDTWKVRLIEEDFHRLMFEETES